jgi:hypothetical protein
MDALPGGCHRRLGNRKGLKLYRACLPGWCVSSYRRAWPRRKAAALWLAGAFSLVAVIIWGLQSRQPAGYAAKNVMILTLKNEKTYGKE